MMSILCMIPLAETLFHNKSHKCAVPGVMNFVPHYVLLSPPPYAQTHIHSVHIAIVIRPALPRQYVLSGRSAGVLTSTVPCDTLEAKRG